MRTIGGPIKPAEPPLVGPVYTYGTTWLQPTTMLQPRIFKFGVRSDPIYTERMPPN